MKKLFLSFAVVAGFAMVSCGGEKAQEATVVEEGTVEEVVETVDSLNTTVTEEVDSLNNTTTEATDSLSK